MTFIPGPTLVPVAGASPASPNPSYAALAISPDGQHMGHVTELLYDILQTLRAQSETEEGGGIVEDDG